MRGTEKDFADEGLWSLSDKHRYDVGYVSGLDLAGIVLLAASEARVDGAWSDDGDADIMRAELFGDGVGEAVESPLGGGVGCSVGEWVAACE